MRLRALAAVRLLLAHDLRLAWREFRSHFRFLDNRAMAALVVVLVLVMHGAAWSTGLQLAAITVADSAGRERVAADLAPAGAFILLLMLAQTLSGLTRTLYGRSDLDLILTSPVPAPIVFAVRVLAVGLGAAASAAIFVIPVADVALAHGGWRSLALLPTLAGAAFATSAVGLVIVMGLLAVLGPRRTRLAAQIVATFIGGGFMVWLQLRRTLGPGALHGLSLPAFACPAFLVHLWLLPLRAAAGLGPAIVLWLAASAGAFVVVVLLSAGRFAAGIAAASGLPASVRPPRFGRRAEHRFGTGLARILCAKEWRLIRRDPWLLSQLLLQILYMTPMLAMLMNGDGAVGRLTVALAPMIVVVAYQVAASITWLSLSAEDAPELLATAPVTPASLQNGKLIAVAQLCAGLAALPLVWLASQSPRAAGETALLAAIGVAMAMLLSIWHTKPAARSGFAARHRESKLLALMEMVMSMLLGVTAALFVVGSAWSLLPLGLAGLVLIVNRPRRRSADHQPARPRETGQQPA
jgi:ABC-2 type transport system permease protein